MAYTPHDADELEHLAKAMKAAAEALLRVAGEMREANFSPIYLQLSVPKNYADSLFRLPGEAQHQFNDQLHAATVGGTPAYLARRKKNAEDKLRRAAATKKPPRKKAR